MLSVIIPCKNEEGNIVNIHKRFTEVLKDIDYELIFIDDGSTDKTLEKIEEIYKEDKEHVKGISFSRNFMKDAAIYAGLENCIGDYACIIDADLQQNPHYLLDMLDFLENNPEYDEVAMVQSKRKRESLLMRSCKRAFYFIIDLLSDTKFNNGASDFRMFRRVVIDTVVDFGEKNRFTKGIFSWIGFNVKYMEYEAEERQSGTTKFNFKASFKYAMNGIYSFSNKPLKLANYVGMGLLFSSFVYLVVMIILLLVDVLSFNVLYIIIWLLLLIGGIQLITIGILGEYLAKTYNEVKDRPIYIAKKKIGFDDKLL